MDKKIVILSTLSQNVYSSKTADWLSKAHLILIFTREHFIQDYMINPGNRAYTQYNNSQIFKIYSLVHDISQLTTF